MTTEDLLKLENKINNSKGREIQICGICLETSYKISQLNFLEFMALIEIANNKAEEYQLKGLSIDSDIKQKQFLTNYLLSTSAFIDHERNVVKNINNEELTEWYKKEISEYFLNNGIHRFYCDFRNYLTHFTSLNFTHSFSHDKNTVSFNYELNRDYLLKWNGWKKESLCWLNEQEETISIKNTINIYNNQIVIAFKKIINKIYQIYSKELKTVEELEDKYKKILENI